MSNDYVQGLIDGSKYWNDHTFNKDNGSPKYWEGFAAAARKKEQEAYDEWDFPVGESSYY